MDNRFFLFILFLIVACDSNKTIFKCCSFHESYKVDTRSGFSGCVPTKDAWTPLVYSQSIQSFLPEGQIPPDWKFVESTLPLCGSGFKLKLIQSHPGVLPGFLLFENGSLWTPELVEELIKPGDYCVDFTTAFACVEDVEIPFVKKCCGKAGIYSEGTSSCIIAESSASYGFTLPGDFVLSSGFPVCTAVSSDAHLVISGTLQAYDIVNYLRRDGSIEINETVFKPSDYCLEQVSEIGSDTVEVFTCVGSVRTDYPDIRFTLYPIGLFISVFFLAATIAVGFLLPTSLHQLHWRCQTGHVACLLVGDLLLAVTQVAGHRITGGVCIAFAILMHFFFLAAFFWLNTMCFNIWWTFRDIRPANLDKMQESCRLRLYALYAWGVPLFIASLAAGFDNLPDSYDGIVRPRFAEDSCWFYGDMEILLYFYIPVGILLLVNLMLFAATARELTCGLWKREVVKASTERATLGRVCVKLVIVMGLTWIIDVISWVVGGPRYLWYIPDIMNTLQGVFIFAVVGCHPQVWIAVKRLWCLKDNQDTSNAVNHLSSCSQGLPSIVDTSTSKSPDTSMTKASSPPQETLC